MARVQAKARQLKQQNLHEKKSKHGETVNKLHVQIRP